MKRRSIIQCGILLLAIGLTVLTLFSMETSGKTIIVAQDGSGDNETIQEAIDAANNSDTIRVYEGEYVENIVVDKSVTIIGNGSTETIVDGNGSLFAFHLTAPWVNISNLCTTGAGGNWNDAGIIVESHNCTITSINSSNNGYDGIQVKSGHSYTIEDSIIASNTNNGIFIVYSTSGRISGNTILSNGDYGILLRYDVHDTFITGNTCKNNVEGIHVFDSDRVTITGNDASYNNNWNIGAQVSSQTIISGNTCTDSAGTGIWIAESLSMTISNNDCSRVQKSGIYLFETSMSSITDNTCNSPGTDNVYGLQMEYHSSHNIVTANTFSNTSGNGVCVSSSDNLTFSYNIVADNHRGFEFIFSPDISVDNNSIHGNRDYGIFADNNFYVVDAKYNWWGSSSGPYHEDTNPEGEGDEITDLVIYDPWTGKTGERNIHYVDDDAPDGGNGSIEAPYNVIQHAIDNATDGDTIRVYDGTYNEHIVVNKILTLIGNGSGLTKIQGGATGSVVHITAPWVNMSGFSVHGGGNLEEDAAIRVESDNCRISQNECSNQYRAGIYVKGADHTAVIDNTITLWRTLAIVFDHSNDGVISGNNCSDTYKTGIAIISGDNNEISGNTCVDTSGGISIDFSSGNTVTGNNCSISRWGITIRASDNTTITNNILTETYDGAIFLFDSSNNSISNNDCSQSSRVGIQLEGSSDNTISDNVCLYTDYGIRLLGSSYNTISNNDCIECGVGIYLIGSTSNSLSGNVIRDCYDTGLRLKENSDDNTIDNNVIVGNYPGIMVDDCDGITAHENDIYDNTMYGIDVSTPGEDDVDATGNWWGSNSGPFHDTQNPTGDGDKVTDRVIFDPWIRGPNHKPVVIVDYPRNNEVINGSSYNISGTAYDVDGNFEIQKVEVQIDTGYWGIATGTANWFIIWIPSDWDDGDHTVYVRAYDGKDYSDIVIIHVKIDMEGSDGGGGDGGGGWDKFCGSTVVFGTVFVFVFIRRKKQSSPLFQTPPHVH